MREIKIVYFSSGKEFYNILLNKTSSIYIFFLSIFQFIKSVMINKSSIFSKWLPIIFIPVLIITILGLSYWFFVYRRWNNKKPPKVIKQSKPISRTIPPKTTNISSPLHVSTTKSFPISSSQLTNTDKAYLDKLVRTASDRSLWQHDSSKKAQSNKLRKVPSGQKNLFRNIQIN
jgi:hypothetical protein